MSPIMWLWVLTATAVACGAQILGTPSSMKTVVLSTIEGIGAGVGLRCVEPLVSGWISDVYFEKSAIAMRFRLSMLVLPPGDSVELVAVDALSFNVSAAHLSPVGTNSGLWTPRLFANLWRLRLWRTTSVSYCDNGFGVGVDRYSYFTSLDSGHDGKTSNAGSSSDEQGCGTRSTHAICNYTTTSPLTSMYAYSRPVVRIWVPTPGVEGFKMCTGWLWGSQGHVITASHCIGSARDARQVQFEFLAEASWCGVDVDYTVCSGAVASVAATWVTTNLILDYTLLLLSSGLSLVQSYGYLQVHPTLSMSHGMPVYVPQHPNGGCKTIASMNRTTLPTTITGLTTKGCDLNNDGFYRGGVMYDADTQPGSSGAPVLAAATNTVVAMHYCGAAACSNAGIPMACIVRDLLFQNLLPTNALGDGRGTIPSFPDPVAFPRAPTLPFRHPPYFGAIRQGIMPRRPRATTVDRYELVVHAPTKIMVDIVVNELNTTSNTCVDVLRDCRITYSTGGTTLRVYSKLLPGGPLYSSDDLRRALPSTGSDDGSISNNDPYLVMTLPAGRYILAFGLLQLADKDAIAGVNTDAFSTDIHEGAFTSTTASLPYKMTISSSEPIDVLSSLPNATLPLTCALSESAIEATCILPTSSSGSQSNEDGI